MKEDWTQLHVPARRPRPEESARTLGQVLNGFVSGVLEKRKCQTDPLVEAWEVIVPPGLKQHCRLKSFDRGQLIVTVSSPSFMYEFNLCSHDLLDEMKRQCPRAGLKKIKCVLG